MLPVLCTAKLLRPSGIKKNKGSPPLAKPLQTSTGSFPECSGNCLAGKVADCEPLHPNPLWRGLECVKVEHFTHILTGLLWGYLYLYRTQTICGGLWEREGVRCNVHNITHRLPIGL